MSEVLQSGLAYAPGREMPFGHFYTVYGIVLRVNPPDKSKDSKNLAQLLIGSEAQWDCDVLVTRGGPSGKGYVIPNVVITQPGPAGAVGKDYEEVLPRGVSKDASNNELLASRGPKGDYSNLDGDRVVVGFLNGQIDCPFIVTYWPHPDNSRDTAKKKDGRRRFSRKNGTELTIRANGKSSFSTTGADDGSIVVDVKKNKTVTIMMDGVSYLTIKDTDSGVQIELGPGAAAAAVVGEILAQIFDAHTHPSAVGPTGPPMPQPVTVEFVEPPLAPIPGLPVNPDKTSEGIVPKVPIFVPTKLGGLLTGSAALSSRVKIPYNG